MEAAHWREVFNILGATVFLLTGFFPLDEPVHTFVAVAVESLTLVNFVATFFTDNRSHTNTIAHPTGLSRLVFMCHCKPNVFEHFRFGVIGKGQRAMFSDQSDIKVPVMSNGD